MEADAKGMGFATPGSKFGRPPCYCNSVLLEDSYAPLLFSLLGFWRAGASCLLDMCSITDPQPPATLPRGHPPVLGDPSITTDFMIGRFSLKPGQCLSREVSVNVSCRVNRCFSEEAETQGL